MKKVNINELEIWNKEDMVEYWGDWGYEKGEYVLKFEMGCRGEEELIGKVDIVDGCIMVRDENDIKDWIRESEGGDVDEDMFEFVGSDIEDWWEGCNVYGEMVFEELSYVYVRVKV